MRGAEGQYLALFEFYLVIIAPETKYDISKG
jgi:hypothetical protein